MFSFNDYFSIQVFFIVLRETLELAIIISVLLAFVDQAANDKHKKSGDYKSIPDEGFETDEHQRWEDECLRLKFNIWAGGIAGFAVCLLVGSAILVVFYQVGQDLWAITEHYWEGVFSIVASVTISFMGVKILRVTKMQKKWRHKLGSAMNNLQSGVSNVAWKERYALFLLPFVTTLREGLEAIVFVGGIGINENTSIASIINAALLGIAIGSGVGIVMFRTGHTLSIQLFLVISTCFLYLVAAGLFAKGVWNLELQRFILKCGGLDVSETGDGPGSYDINQSVWHVNCCNGERAEDGVWWMLFTAVLGWTNSATYGSVISYNLYWLFIISMFTALIYEERFGQLPLVPAAWQKRRIAKRLLLDDNLSPRNSVDSINSRTELNVS